MKCKDFKNIKRFRVPLHKDLIENKVIINPFLYGESGEQTIKDFEEYKDLEGLDYIPINEAMEKAIEWYKGYSLNRINDFNVYVCLQDKSYDKKPDVEETKKINNTIANKHIICTFKEFKDRVGNKGTPFCCGIFSNIDGSSWLRRIKNNFVWQQIWALDFDEGVTFDEFILRAEKYHIPPNFVYKTMSCNDETLNKFRAVWVADFACVHTTLAESISKLLMTVFPESDKACKDASRIYFGGKGIIYENDFGYLSRLSLLNLINAVQQFIEDIDYTHRLDRMRAISEDTKICLNNGIFDVKITTIPNIKTMCIDKKKLGIENSNNSLGYAMDFLSNTYKELVDENILPDEDSIYVLVRKLDNEFNKWYVMRTNWTGTRKVKKTVKKEKGIYTAKSNYENIFKRKRERGIKKEDLEKKCKLCKELFKDNYLSFLQLFGICTNLINIEGGLNIFKDSLKKSKHNIGRNTDWQEHSEIVNKQELFSMQCNNFCPYAKECKHRQKYNRNSENKKKYCCCNR